ncbi:MAG: urease accessory protein UreD [Paraglaciecola sp.]|uniref:urease accessory protein UreD n=1 Tax=Paraglaciecola sp. TaxID=1920173 RepID=UPI0032968006
MTVALDVTKSHWLASLDLELGHSEHGTQLTRTKRSGPLTIQKAFYPEGRDCAHLYLLHPPAGIVSGDKLNVGIDVQDNAHTLVTTPGANRFYRARTDLSIGDPNQTQVTQITLGGGAKCEHFPLETIVYNQADGINNVEVRLQKNSMYCGWDMTCLGLPSSSESFTGGSFTQLNTLYCDDILLYHDRVQIDPTSQIQQHDAGLANNTVFGTFLAYASDEQVSKATRTELIEQLRDVVEQHNANSLISITDIRQLLVIRYLGQQAHQCKDLFIALWKLIRPIYIEKHAIQPRIWFT